MIERDTTESPGAPAPEDSLIFVVDDHGKLLEGVARFLRGLGYPVETFTDPAVALEAFSERNVSLLLTDKEMPGIDGIELARRAMERDPDLAVIMFTGVPDSSSAADSLRLGLEEYLQKPVDLERLEEAVRRALSRRLNHKP